MFQPISREQHANAKRIVAEEKRLQREKLEKETKEKAMKEALFKAQRESIREDCVKMFRETLIRNLRPDVWRRCQEETALHQARGQSQRCVIHEYLRDLQPSGKDDICAEYFGNDSSVTGLPRGSTLLGYYSPVVRGRDSYAFYDAHVKVD